MADSTVIKEFLVALGYKTDETAMKKFTGGISSATKAVVKLGAAVEGVALVVAVGVARFASNLEQLYFAAQRTGSSADQLQAFALASRNFGSSIEEAMSAAENLATFMRKNPGGQNFIASWLRQVGVDAKSLHGEVDWLKALSKLFTYQREHGQTYLAEQLAGQFGISEHQMLAMSTPGYAAELDKQLKLTKGFQAASEAAHKFEVMLANVKMRLEQVLLGLVGPMLTGEGNLISKFSKFISHHGAQIVRDINYVATNMMELLGHLLDWLDTHGNEIQNRIQQAFGQIKTTYEMVRPALVWIYDKFVELDHATDGWSTKLVVLAGVLKAVGATGIVTGIASLGVALAKSLGVAVAASEGTGAWALAGAAWGLAAAVAIGAGLGAILDHYFPHNPLAKAGEWIGGAVYEAVQHANEQMSRQFPAGGTPGTPKDWYATHYPWQPPPAAGGNGSSSVAMKTDIHVYGAGSDHRTLADMIAERQARVNAEIIREFAPDNR